MAGRRLGSDQGARVELCCFYVNCVVFTLFRVLSRDIIRIDLPHAGVASGELWGAPGGPWEAAGPHNFNVLIFCRIRSFFQFIASENPDSALNSPAN